MAEFFMCLECQLQPPFVIMWLKLPKCPLPTLSTPRISSKKITLSLTITIQHVIFMEWLHFTIHQFFKSAMQGISSLFELSMSNSKSKLLLCSHPLIKPFQPPSICDLGPPSIFSNLLKPCIRPWFRARLGLLGTIRFQARQNMFFHRELRGSPKRFHQWSPSYTTASQSARPLHLSFC